MKMCGATNGFIRWPYMCIRDSPYIALIKRLAVNERLDFDTAKLLIAAYKKETRKDEMT